MANSDSDKMTAHCPCGAKLKVPAAVAGRKVRCPKCKAVFIAPDLPPVEKKVEPTAEPTPEPTEALSAFEELVQQERTATTKSTPESASRQTSCPECGTTIPGNASLCVQCGYNIDTGKKTKAASARAARVSATARRMATGTGGFILGCALSAGGALMGAAIWAGITIASEYEIGWLACILGGLAGGGMVLGYREKNQRAGVVAAGFAVLGIGAARLMMILFSISSGIEELVETREFKEAVLAIHLAQPDYWEQNLPPWEKNAWSELVSQKIEEELAPLSNPEFAQAWQSFQEWSSDVKWEDVEFVRVFLINRLARQGLPDDLVGEPPISLDEWEQRCGTATADVAAMSIDERVARAKEIKIEAEVSLDADELVAMLTDFLEDASLQEAQEEIAWTSLFVDHPIDLLFIGLALIGAYKLASGSGDDE